MPSIQSLNLAGIHDMAVLNALRTIQANFQALSTNQESAAQTGQIDQIRTELAAMRSTLASSKSVSASTSAIPSVVDDLEVTGVLTITATYQGVTARKNVGEWVVNHFDLMMQADAELQGQIRMLADSINQLNTRVSALESA